MIVISSNTGNYLNLQIFGESHGEAVGFVLDAFPSGIPIDKDVLNRYLERRRPGKKSSTLRKETDQIHWLSGIKDEYSNGNPISAIFYNKDHHSKDYDPLSDVPRPSHGDYPYRVKFGSHAETIGGGHYSGRLTLPLTAAGALCQQVLKRYGINSCTFLTQIGEMRFPDYESLDENRINEVEKQEIPVLANEKEASFYINEIRTQKDSVGSTVQAVFQNLPIGLGSPFFQGLDSRIASILFSIPGVKSVEFGDGAILSQMKGSVANDPYYYDGRIQLKSNHNGGVLAGLSTGESLIVTVHIKPTPSIGLSQDSVNLKTKENEKLQMNGRHDPCIGIRATVVVEAAINFVLADLLLENENGFK
ncbi:MAG: chorismate synthase [Tissierellia bacterium]|nr:chorismate synthase [Tissierellia bacterium]